MIMISEEDYENSKPDFYQAVDRIEKVNLEALKQITDGNGLNLVLPLRDHLIIGRDIDNPSVPRFGFGLTSRIPKYIQDEITEAYDSIFLANKPVQS
jgi:hypothetical protein